MRICVMSILTIAVTAGAHRAKADQVVIDLGRQPTDTPAKVPARGGDVVTVMLTNRLPHQSYLLTVERRVIDVPQLLWPIRDSGPTGAEADCSALLTQADSLQKAEDETVVADTVEALDRALERGDCKDPQALTKITSAIAMTLGPTPGAYALKGGEELDITVTRTRDGKTKKWRTIVSTGPRGRWLTSYGFATVPSKDQKLFAKSEGNGKFLITPEQRPRDLKLIPSAFFTWLPSSRQLSNWSPGLAAGLGVTQDSPAVFLGASLMHNWNLCVVAGLSVAQHARPNGKYVMDQELSESLSSDQLNDRAHRATWMAALTYRFGSNPFANSDQRFPPKATPSPSPSTTTPRKSATATQRH